MREVKIEKIYANEVFDSRGNPTVQVTVVASDGSKGISKVPSGASTGAYEAVELRDEDAFRFCGKGVKTAIENVNTIIADSLIGENIFNQEKIDNIMIELDGTENKSRLGANSILGVSMAVAYAAANSMKIPLYKYIGGISGSLIPMPMMNILNGGKHADNNLNIQEFMIVPLAGKSFKEYMKIGVEIYHTLKKVLKEKGLYTAVGDEGGFAPDLENDEEALKIIIEAISKAGYVPGLDVAIALDVAATEMYDEAKKINEDSKYYFWKTKELKNVDEMIEYYSVLCQKYPIISIEDGLSEEDWQGWRKLTEKLGDKIKLVGDDLFVTNINRIKMGLESKVANCVLIKPNQIGTLSETLKSIKLSKNNGYSVIISHRSGETEDTFIADLAVAVNAGFIKSGAPCRTERVAKYNRLINIENEMG